MSWDALLETTVQRSDDALTAVVAALAGVPRASVPRPLQSVRAAYPGRVAGRKADSRARGLLGIEACALEEAALDLQQYSWLSNDHIRAITDSAGWERRDLVRRLVWSRLSEQERAALRTAAMSRHGHSGAATHAFDLIHRRLDHYEHLINPTIVRRIRAAATDEARRIIRSEVWDKLALDDKAKLVSEAMKVIGAETHGLDLLFEELVEYEDRIEPEDVARIRSEPDAKARRKLTRTLLWDLLDDFEKDSLMTRAMHRLGRLGYV